MSSPGNIYQNMEVSASNHLKLVSMLYDGAIRFLNEAIISIQNRNLSGKAIAIDRTLAILGELQGTLNFEEGGEVAVSLDKLYTYMTDRILDASARLNAASLNEVIKLLRIINSAWSEIAQKAELEVARPASSSFPMPSPVLIQTGETRQTLEVFG